MLFIWIACAPKDPCEAYKEARSDCYEESVPHDLERDPYLSCDNEDIADETWSCYAVAYENGECMDQVGLDKVESELVVCDDLS